MSSPKSGAEFTPDAAVKGLDAYSADQSAEMEFHTAMQTQRTCLQQAAAHTLAARVEAGAGAGHLLPLPLWLPPALLVLLV